MSFFNQEATMSRKQFFISLMAASFLGAALALGVYAFMPKSGNYNSIADRQNARFSNNILGTKRAALSEGLSFVEAAEASRPAVVHVRVSYGSQQTTNRQNNRSGDPFEDFFRQFGEGDRFQMPGPQAGSGSGVIITDDGYIATNNHVVDNGKDIEVVLNDKRSYKAKIVGTDPSTDLALLKIEATNLPFLPYGNSETLRVGEWVLAVGNPFELTSTVTAGIVSAKGRNLNLINDLQGNSNYAIESFIQTDAAVNPGNSGGALVNLKGELVGINTAIASRTGTYAGYSFAVPVEIVKKIMDDLMRYGKSQRALLGVQIRDVDAKLAQDEGLKDVKGVYLAAVADEGAAKAAGLKNGDVIIKVDGTEVNSTADLQAIIATKRPGDKIALAYLRAGKEYETQATLRNKTGTTDMVAATEADRAPSALGAEFGEVSDKEKSKLGISHGVKVLKLGKGKLAEAGIKEGFIITFIGETAIKSPDDVEAAVQERKRVIAIEGVYPSGDKAYYAIGW
jgi:Do/DeqQ family serine protease